MAFTRRLLLAGALIGAVAAPARAADVGVSVSIGQPGFYGRIDIGDFPRPRLIYAEPRIVTPMPPGMSRRPIYLHVPPGHAKDWAKHCGKYAACGQPVYFVEERWYQDVYAPRYRAQHSGAKREAYRRDDDRRHDDRRAEERRRYEERRRDDGQRYEERRREEERRSYRDDDRRGNQGRPDKGGGNGGGKGNGNGGGKGKGRDD